MFSRLFSRISHKRTTGTLRALCIAFTLTAALTGLTATTSGCASTDLAAPAQSAAVETTTLRSFTSEAAGFHTHSWYVDTGSQVIVFDAQFTEPLAEALLKDIRKHTSSPITHVVVTHPNPDKFNGAAVFQREGAKVVASKSTAAAIAGVHAYKRYYFIKIAKMFTEKTYPIAATVDETFTGSLDLAGGAVQLRELGHSGVSSTQTVAYVPATRDLMVGDLVHHQTHAWLEGGIVDGKPAPNLIAWKAALAEVQKRFPHAIVHGGRGASAPVAQAVAAQTTYLVGMEQLIRSYIADLDAAGRKELAGDGAAKHHKAIAAKAAARFPGYAHAYLVEYGAYGLIGALLGE